uniref:Uncharacterized protein n=1 Tax=Dulem virus 268 TaxID=3145745 RepID=A0AAU8B6W0_9VIRU
MFTKIIDALKLAFKTAIPIVLVGMILASFVLSCLAVSRSSRTEKAVVELQKDMINLSSSINNNLSAIEAHLAVIDKAAGNAYMLFYGNMEFSTNDTDNSTTKTKSR